MKPLKLSGRMVHVPLDEKGEAVFDHQARIEELKSELETIWKKGSNHELLTFEDCNRIRDLINK